MQQLRRERCRRRGVALLSVGAPPPGAWEALSFMQAPGSWAPPGAAPIDWRTSRPAKVGGHHRPSAVTGCDGWSLGGVRCRRTRDALPGRSANGRGDHPRDALGWARPVRGQASTSRRSRRRRNVHATSPLHRRDAGDDRKGAPALLVVSGSSSQRLWRPPLNRGCLGWKSN